jgi:hypothetical protein
MTPGHRPRLESLLRAAKTDKNVRHVAALDHVLSCFGPKHIARLPPPLFLQDKNPGMLQLLQTPSQTPVAEALAVCWDDAKVLFQKRHSRPPSGRVRPLPARFLELVESVLMLLDAPRLVVELLSGEGPPSFDLRLEAAAAAPPSMRRPQRIGAAAVVFDGDVQHDTSELRYVLGCALSGGLSRNLLGLCLPRAEVETLLSALALAFGKAKPENPPPGAMDLTSQLWQLVTPQNQRRLPDLLGDAPLPRVESLVEASKQSGRRTGLFVSGDFGMVARRTIRECGLSDVELDSTYGLESLAKELPPVADLFRLAISPVFADARWNASARSASPNTTSKNQGSSASADGPGSVR